MQFELMLPTTRKFPFSDPGWIFEPKWDGYRALCLIEHDSVRFMSRNKKELTKRFPELLTINKSIKAHSAILDGEIVGLDENNVPCFQNLQNRRQCVIVYRVFDCLMLNGNDLRNEPLIIRKKVLEQILIESPRIEYTDHVVENGKKLFKTVEKLGLEGIVGKKADSRYVGGRTKEWLKIKTRAGIEVMKKRVETWGR
jgi:bifunctional non-homologous end joining protein LigD